METELLAISPVDGRYRSKVHHLSKYFSEYALMKYRLFVEIKYVLYEEISKIFGITSEDSAILNNIYDNFDINECKKIKIIESKINHDVKSVEIYIQDKLKEINRDYLCKWIHFGLTSQDVNSVSTALQLTDFMTAEFIPLVDTLVTNIQIPDSDIPMLARTHGQPATPTTVGAQLMVFVERITNIMDKIVNFGNLYCKFGGATGGFSAHKVIYPQVDWVNIADNFAKSLGLRRHKYTTQIEHFDGICNLLQLIVSLNNVLVDFSRDQWSYISYGYYTITTTEDTVGSSTMPHKVNPILFENAEGSLLTANATLNHLISTLPQSRLQRDLSSSTSLRYLGSALATTILAYQGLVAGMKQVKLNKLAIAADLEQHYEVFSENIQMMMRMKDDPNGYTTVMRLFKKPNMTKSEYENIIENLLKNKCV